MFELDTFDKVALAVLAVGWLAIVVAIAVMVYKHKTRGDQRRSQYDVK